jgi:molybdopterin synthase sulfur carrier subunit
MGTSGGNGLAPVQVRLWAAARAAAGVPEVSVPVERPVPLTWLREEVIRLQPGAERLPGVLGVCSVLVGDQPVGKADPATVLVRPGDTVEFLPPFAGG